MRYLWILLSVTVLSTSSLYAQKSKEDANCFTICHTTVKKLCPKYNYPLNWCLKECEKWTDRNIECMHTAQSCKQINLKNGTCKEIDLEDPYIYEKPKPIDPRCHKACTNYKKCTGYADDATPADTQEAYKTCMQECQGWSKKTIKCMSKVRVRKAADCMAVSRCGLLEYTGRDIYNMR